MKGISEQSVSAVMEIARKYGCEVLIDEPMSRHTSFRVGGKCACFIDVCSLDCLSELITYISSNRVPYYVIGRGTNLIVDDGYIPYIMLHIGKRLADIRTEGEMLYCRSGAMLSAVCVTALENSLTGLEFAYGIPGRIGGAVFMNAGAYGGEMKDVVVYADAMDNSGNIHRFEGEALKMDYRRSVFTENRYIITDVCLRLSRGDKALISAKINELFQKRREKQPIELPSAGSTFKRPVGSYAGMLIEQCGLKGYRVGGAMVSEKHSGFVVNAADASFADIMAVIEHVRNTVKEQTGYVLECEPEIIRGCLEE